MLEEVLQYDPDLILLYIGHNEFEEVEQLNYAGLDRIWAHEIIDHLAFTRIVQSQLSKNDLEQRRQNQATLIADNPVHAAGKAWDHVWLPGEIDERMRQFEENLTAMVTACQTRGVAIVLGTIPSNHWAPALADVDRNFWEEVRLHYVAGRFEEGYRLAQERLVKLPRHQSSRLENEIILRVAARSNCDVADVLSAIEGNEPHGVPGETLFEDECHVSPKGALIQLHVFGDGRGINRAPEP